MLYDLALLVIQISIIVLAPVGAWFIVSDLIKWLKGKKK